MFSIKKYLKIKNKGFTIIETLVAISILVIAVTGPLSLASRGLAYSQYAKDEVTAFYLANEALDVIRNIRDTNIRSGKPWLEIPSQTGSPITILDKCTGNGCYFDVWKNPPDLKNSFWDPGSDTKLKNCTKDGLAIYGHTFSWSGISGCSDTDGTVSPTIFNRRIVIKHPVNTFTNEIKVDVIVEWEAKNGIQRNVVLSANMYKLGSI